MTYNAFVAMVLVVATPMSAANNYSAWKMSMGRKLGSFEEETIREQVFKSNMEIINEHNAEAAMGKHTYTLGWGPFTDMTTEEWRATFLSNAEAHAANSKRLRNVVTLQERWLDAEVDWRTKGAVTPVKNQGQCGSCWSFSTTGSTEGRVQIATGKLTSLSEQQLMDCSTKKGNYGCQGGLMDYGFKYIIDNKGINSEADYPSKQRNEKCNKAKEAHIVATITSHKDVTPNSASQLQAALAQGPVSVAIEADQRTFQLYKSGVLSASACGKQLDHGVLAVGYTSDYWIVKNSWGATWGMEGYIHMARNSQGAAGQCGILMQPSYPIAGSAPAPPRLV